MGASIDLRPEQVDIDLYEGDAWSIVVSIPSLGDLTGATIVGKFENTEEGPIETLDFAPTDLVNSKFAIGQNPALVSGTFDVQITLPASLPRTYIFGRLSVSRRVA